MKKKISVNKLEQALVVLNQGARQRRKEFSKLIRGKYRGVNRILAQAGVNGKRIARTAEKSVLRAEKNLVSKAKHFDHNVHENPWPYMGAVAISSLVLGALIGHKENGRKNHKNGKASRKIKHIKQYKKAA